ncbi:ribosome silencing factor [endosymbiont of Pachyrhynchus infernalis]|uniref:ribosome silencing factor n=1 Tax=endosymbiont of Pachyrhynchus infernalis TaxID=1971488 RepID=UPI000DC718E5|nr:ribosome silencing factor [endosymbiont of Pachyrhynchus infernalis]BBA84928.1 ribosomal silencing factor RsfS [endosymbiont of Pachyrhynchus infernalis]
MKKILNDKPNIRKIYNKILDLKVKDISIFKSCKNNSLLDYILICTANSKEHIKYIKYNFFNKSYIKNINFFINEDNLYEWIIIDLININIHIMQKHIRNYYLIDNLYRENYEIKYNI